MNVFAHPIARESADRARQHGWFGFVAFCCTLGLLTAPRSAAGVEGVSALKANDFLDTIGVCTHINQGADNAVNVAQCLAFIGFRGIREDGSGNPQVLQSLINVYKTSGAKVCLLPRLGSIADSLNEYETLAAAGALLAAEGPNEPNNFKVTYQGAKSSDKTSLPIAYFQRDLYAAVKADRKLAGIPVFHSSEAGGSEPDNCGLQFLTIPSGAGALLPDGTRYADYANAHNYICGHGLKGITEDNIAWHAEDPTLSGKWDGLRAEYGHTWWGKGFNGYINAELETLPRVTTETGWTTKPGGGVDSASISEEEQGKLFLNLYLAAFKRGWSFTSVYMLHDSADQGYWGFVHTDYSYKPSATYLHNMTTILADKSTSIAPSKLNYSIPDEPAAIHDLLLQKSNGTFELAVWGEQASGSSNVSVNLGGKYTPVKIYDPTVGTSPVQTLPAATTVSLTLSDHPLIIEIASHRKLGTSPLAAAPSAEQIRKLNAAESALSHAESLYKENKMHDATAAFTDAQNALVEVAAMPELAERLAPLKRRLINLHDMMELDGAKVPAVAAALASSSSNAQSKSN